MLQWREVETSLGAAVGAVCFEFRDLLVDAV